MPLWNVEAPAVGAFLLPKNELILVYPGAGQTKPLGLNTIIFPSDDEKLFISNTTGIKKIQTKKISITKNIKNLKKILEIIITPIDKKYKK